MARNLRINRWGRGLTSCARSFSKACECPLYPEHVDDRLDALKLMRKAEARKITQPTVSAADERANRELWRQVEIARRRVAMVNAGLWPPPKGWINDLRRENYVTSPEGISR